MEDGFLTGRGLLPSVHLRLEDEMENFGDEKAWLEHCHMLMLPGAVPFTVPFRVPPVQVLRQLRQRNCDMNIAGGDGDRILCFAGRAGLDLHLSYLIIFIFVCAILQQ